MTLLSDRPIKRTSPSQFTESQLRPIPLGELPQWCSHVAALFQQGSPYGKRSRNASVGEYEQHYAACLKYCRELGDDATFDDVRLYQVGIVRRGFESCLPCQNEKAHRAMLSGGRYVIDLNYFAQTFNRRPLQDAGGGGAFIAVPPICASVGDDLFEVPLDEAFQANPKRLADEIGRAGQSCRTVVELGAGFGYNLSRIRERLPSVKLVSADASPAALETARRLFQDDANASARAFDFYDAASYEFIASLEAPILVYTSAAIEQLPSAAPLFDGLAQYREKIARVIHLEPVYRPEDECLLGMLRRRYIETWDYTRDLKTRIEGRDDIRLLREEPNVFGVNPLNPLSLLEWQYTA